MAILLIAIFSVLSYAAAILAIFRGEYKPNIYSRVIWSLLAINALIGLIRLGNGNDVIALSVMQTIGSLIILIGAFRFSILKFGRVELASSILLAISLLIWIIGDYPAINVAISLIAHFIGGIPTISAVYRKPHSENMMFWGYFAIASLIALATASKSNFKDYMFPLYFSLYNIGIFVLSARQHSARHNSTKLS